MISRQAEQQASEDTDDESSDSHNESDDEYWVKCKHRYQIDMDLYRKCLASGITKYVCNGSTPLATKVDLLLRAVEQDLPILPQHYLAVIKQIKQGDVKKLYVLEQKFNSVKSKRKQERRSQFKDSEDY
jgi:hypothetical protein